MPRGKRNSKPTEPPGRVPAGEENFASPDLVLKSGDVIQVSFSGYMPGPGPCDESAPIPEGTTCQEAAAISKQFYIPCGNPAVVIVHHAKDNRAYYMCEMCATHSINNRGGVLVLPPSQLVMALPRMAGLLERSDGSVVFDDPISTPAPALAPAPAKRKRRTKAQIEEEQAANQRAAETQQQVPASDLISVPAPAPAPAPAPHRHKSDAEPLMAFEDIVILADIEGVPLLSFITQTLQLMGQGKKITNALEGEKDKDGKIVSGGLRPAINEFLARSGAPGFIFVDTMNDNRVFSFRRVGGVKETLDPVLLLQNGCPTEALAASTVKTEYVSLTIREIKGK